MNQPEASFQVSTSFQNLLDTVFHSIPKILVFLLILIIGWIVARVLSRLVNMLLRRVKFDRFVERGVVGQALARSNTDATWPSGHQMPTCHSSYRTEPTAGRESANPSHQGNRP